MAYSQSRSVGTEGGCIAAGKSRAGAVAVVHVTGGRQRMGPQWGEGLESVLGDWVFVHSAREGE